MALGYDGCIVLHGFRGLDFALQCESLLTQALTAKGKKSKTVTITRGFAKKCLQTELSEHLTPQNLSLSPEGIIIKAETLNLQPQGT